MLLSFLKKYKTSKEKAKGLMQLGDINSYMRELIESERAIEHAESILLSQC